MKRLILVFALGTFVVWSACTSNNEEDLPKPSGSSCDTMNMGYQDDIAMMFQKNHCLDCHSAQIATAGIVLDNYNDVSTHADKILPSISWPASQPAAKKMPVGGPQVTPCEIQKFSAWMSQGKKP